LIPEEEENGHEIKISRNGLYLPELKSRKKRIKVGRVNCLSKRSKDFFKDQKCYINNAIKTD
jgi:hypothetical protein